MHNDSSAQIQRSPCATGPTGPGGESPRERRNALKTSPDDGGPKLRESRVSKEPPEGGLAFRAIL